MIIDALDDNQQKLLPYFKELRPQFYLAGGTALALQIGHRKSYDFDFFATEKFTEPLLQVKLQDIFNNEQFAILDQQWQTVECMVNSVKTSFFYFPYPLLELPIEVEYLRLASIMDIGCMKLNAIVNRSVNRDFIDLYFILQRIPLVELLERCNEKMPSLNENAVLKSLVYFDEVKMEPLEFLPGKEVSWETVRYFFINEVRSMK